MKKKESKKQVSSIYSSREAFTCKKGYVIEISALLKQYEVREVTDKSNKVFVGTELCLCGGPWVVWCEVVSRIVVLVHGCSSLHSLGHF